MKPIIALEINEWETIIAALEAVAPSGGGSTPFHLALKLRNETGATPSDQLVGHFQISAHNEVRIALYDGEGIRDNS